MQRQNKNVLLYIISLMFFMFSSSYMAVPLYRIFCKLTGLGGTLQQQDVSNMKENHFNDFNIETKLLKIKFNADVNTTVPWKFFPLQTEILVKPGETTLTFYSLENLSEKTIVGISTYNVTPAIASLYFNKIQCFCFEQQLLQPKEKIDLPIFFFIDPEFSTDTKTKTIDTIILSYTFFKVTEN